MIAWTSIEMRRKNLHVCLIKTKGKALTSAVHHQGNFFKKMMKISLNQRDSMMMTTHKKK